MGKFSTKARAIQCMEIADAMLTKYPHGFSEADVIRDFFYIPGVAKKARAIIDAAAALCRIRQIPHRIAEEAWVAWYDVREQKWYANVWIKKIVLRE